MTSRPECSQILSQIWGNMLIFYFYFSYLIFYHILCRIIFHFSMKKWFHIYAPNWNFDVGIIFFQSTAFTLICNYEIPLMTCVSSCNQLSLRLQHGKISFLGYTKSYNSGRWNCIFVKYLSFSDFFKSQNGAESVHCNGCSKIRPMGLISKVKDF